MIKTIYIVGPAGAGKSSFAKLLGAALERATPAAWPVGDTSGPLIRWLAEIRAADAAGGVPGAASVNSWQTHILENKEQFRPQLVKLADVARSILAFALVAKVENAGARIVTGLRRREEFPCGALVASEHMPEFSVRAKVEGRIVIYVDCPGKPAADGFDAEFYSVLAHYRVSQRGILSTEGLAYQAGLIAAQLLKECA